MDRKRPSSRDVSSSKRATCTWAWRETNFGRPNFRERRELLTPRDSWRSDRDIGSVSFFLGRVNTFLSPPLEGVLNIYLQFRFIFYRDFIESYCKTRWKTKLIIHNHHHVISRAFQFNFKLREYKANLLFENTNTHSSLLNTSRTYPQSSRYRFPCAHAYTEATRRQGSAR